MSLLRTKLRAVHSQMPLLNSSRCGYCPTLALPWATCLQAHIIVLMPCGYLDGMFVNVIFIIASSFAFGMTQPP
jgi:hypothetical protein